MIATINWADVMSLFEEQFDKVLNCKGKKAYLDCITGSNNSVDGATSKWAGVLILDALVHFTKENFSIGTMKSLRRHFNQHTLLADCISQAAVTSSPVAEQDMEVDAMDITEDDMDIIFAGLTSTVFDDMSIEDASSSFYSTNSTAPSLSRYGTTDDYTCHGINMPYISQPNMAEVVVHFSPSFDHWKSIDSLINFYMKSIPKSRSKARFIETLYLFREILLFLYYENGLTLEHIIVRMIEYCIQGSQSPVASPTVTTTTSSSTTTIVPEAVVNPAPSITSMVTNPIIPSSLNSMYNSLPSFSQFDQQEWFILNEFDCRGFH